MIGVGDHVRHYFLTGRSPSGWALGEHRFGVVIGTHIADAGVNPSGLHMATVRWKLRDGHEDTAIAQFLLDKVEPHPSNIAA